MQTTSIRMPDEVYRHSKAIAERRRISMNQLVQEALQRVISDEQEREMFEAATLLGEDPETSNVEFAFAAQAEAVMRNEP